jgi:hypothetical protein
MGTVCSCVFNKENVNELDTERLKNISNPILTQ